MKSCPDPERLRVLTNKGVRIENYLEIKEKYDETKSKSENAKLCGVSESTIARFWRNRAELETICCSYFGI